MPDTIKQPKSFSVHHILIFISCIMTAVVCLGIMVSSISAFLVPVTEGLGISRAAYTLHLTIAQLIMGFSSPFWGAALKKVDIRILATVLLIVFAGGYVIMSRAQTITMFYVLAVPMGLARGFLLYLPIPYLINNWFKVRAATFLGIASAASGIANSIFTPIWNSVIMEHGWRTGYVVMGVVCMVLLLPFTIFVMRNRPADVGKLPFGANAASETVESAAVTKGITMKNALKTPMFWFLFIGTMLLSIPANIMSHIPGLGMSLGFDQTTAILCASTAALGLTVGKIFTGFLNDQIGTKRSTLISCLIPIVGTLVLLNATGKVAFLLVGGWMIGMGISMINVQPAVITKEIVGMKDFSPLYGMTTVAIGISGSLAVTMYAMIYDATGSYFWNFVIMATCYAVTIPLFLISMVSAKKYKHMWE